MTAPRSRKPHLHKECVGRVPRRGAAAAAHVANNVAEVKAGRGGRWGHGEGEQGRTQPPSADRRCAIRTISQSATFQRLNGSGARRSPVSQLAGEGNLHLKHFVMARFLSQLRPHALHRHQPLVRARRRRVPGFARLWGARRASFAAVAAGHWEVRRSCRAHWTPVHNGLLAGWQPRQMHARTTQQAGRGRPAIGVPRDNEGLRVTTAERVGRAAGGLPLGPRATGQRVQHWFGRNHKPPRDGVGAGLNASPRLLHHCKAALPQLLNNL
jgi:hypothetical protein